MSSPIIRQDNLTSAFYCSFNTKMDSNGQLYRHMLLLAASNLRKYKEPTTHEVVGFYQNMSIINRDEPGITRQIQSLLKNAICAVIQWTVSYSSSN